MCPSGDVLFRAEASESRSLLKWIDVSTFKLGKISSTKRLIRDSVAADLNENARLAQAPDVLCQRWVKEGILLRRVRDQNGQCFDEIINTYKGTIISREPAPCDSNC